MRASDSFASSSASSSSDAYSSGASSPEPMDAVADFLEPFVDNNARVSFNNAITTSSDSTMPTLDVLRDERCLYFLDHPERILPLDRYSSLFVGVEGARLALSALSGVAPDGAPFAVCPGESLPVEHQLFWDVDTLCAVTSQVPAVGTVSLYLSSAFQDTIRNQDYCTFSFPGSSAKQIKDIPNLMLARFGDCSRFKLNIAFPHLNDGEEQQHPYAVYPPERAEFIDLILLPSLRAVCPTRKFNNFSLSQAGDAYRNRRSNNQFAFKGSFLPAHLLADTATYMRSLISMSPGLSRFRDFVFVTHGLGLKANFSDPADIPLEFSDLNWSIIDPQNTFLDIGCEIQPAEDSSPCVGLWRTNPAMDTYFPYSSLVSSFWNSSLRPLAKSNCRFDSFSLFDSIGGFDYHSRSPSPVSPAKISGLRKVIAYGKIKQPFYAKSAASDRTSKDFNVSELWSTSKAFDARVKFLRNLFRDMNDCSFGARIEFRLPMTGVADQFDQLAVITRNVVRENVHWIATDALARFWSLRLNALVAAVHNVRAQELGRFNNDRSFEVLIFVAALGSALTSRPDDHGDWKKVMSVLAARRCSVSDLMLVPNIFDLDPSSGALSSSLLGSGVVPSRFLDASAKNAYLAGPSRTTRAPLVIDFDASAHSDQSNLPAPSTDSTTMEIDSSFALPGLVDIQDHEMDALRLEARQWPTIKSLFRRLCSLTADNTDSLARSLLDLFLSEQLQIIQANDRMSRIDRFNPAIQLSQVGYNNLCQVDGYREVFQPSMFVAIKARTDRVKPSDRISTFVFPFPVVTDRDPDISSFLDRAPWKKLVCRAAWALWCDRMIGSGCSADVDRLLASIIRQLDTEVAWLLYTEDSKLFRTKKKGDSHNSALWISKYK